MSVAPALSICIPNYNMGPWVANAIRSALMQPVNEVVVVDNASTDESLREMVAIEDERLTVHAYRDHVPMFENINRAVSLTSGNWCVVLCADDELLASFHGQFVRGADKHPDAAAVSQSAIDPIVPRIVGDTQPVVYRDASSILRSSLLPVSATAFRRSAYDAVGGFDADAGWPADWDFWIRLVMRCGPVHALGAPGALYHRSRGAWASVENSLHEIEIFEAWVEHRRREWPADVIHEMLASLAERHERVGRLLLRGGDDRGIALLRAAASAGRESASRRLWLEEHQRLAGAYRALHRRGRRVVRHLEARFPA